MFFYNIWCLNIMLILYEGIHIQYISSVNEITHLNSLGPGRCDCNLKFLRKSKFAEIFEKI